MDSRSRVCDIRIDIGPLPPGSYNAITDVEGVHMGYKTLIHGDGALVIGQGPVRTGVTAILPQTHNLRARVLGVLLRFEAIQPRVR